MFKNLSIKFRLYTITAVVCVAFVLFSVMSITALSDVNDKSTEVSGRWLPSVKICGEINTLTSDYRVAQYNHIVSSTPDAILAMDKRIGELDVEIEKKFDEYEELVKATPASLEKVKNIRKDWAGYKTASEDILKLSREGKTALAVQMMLGKSYEMFVDISKKISEFADLASSMSSKASDDADLIYAKTYKFLVASSIVVIILALAVMINFISTLTTRLNVLVDMMKRFADCDFSARVKITRNDELGVIAGAANVMMDEVSKVIQQVQHTAQQVAASSEELTAGADQSADVTNNIATSIAGVSDLSKKFL